MRRLSPIAILSGFLCALGACHATPRSDPEPSDLLGEAIGILSTQALGREGVDWESVERELRHELDARLASGTGDAETILAQRAAVGAAVARLGDPHARWVAPPLAAPPQPAESPQSAAQPLTETPAEPARFVPTMPLGVMLPDRIAYLLLPGCGAANPSEGMPYAHALRARVAELAGHQPSGWLVDLRLNGGGNVWPMLLGLQPLLGSGVWAGSRGLEGEHWIGGDANSVWLQNPDGSRHVQMEMAPASTVARVRVAVLIGGWTMSSGELVALALRGLPERRFFGEDSAGLTTATQEFPLRDGSRLILPISWMMDAAGNVPGGPIEPEETVPYGDWPERDDAAARRARAWLLERR